MNFPALSTFASRSLKAITATALVSMLAGCAIGDIALSGPNPTDPNITAHAGFHGNVIGGQNPVSFSSLNLYAVDNSAYGGVTHSLTKVLSGTSEYYPGGTTGCNNAALTVSAYAITNGTATFLANNSMIAGQLILISDLAGSGFSGTYLVTTATATSFSVATTLANSAGAPSGTFNPICYTVPVTDLNGNYNVTGDFACGSFGSSVVYLQATGGNPGLTAVTTNNTSLVLTALLQSGPTSQSALTCSQLSSANTVILNELTTAAMAISMGQFFTTTYGGVPSTDTFGAPNNTQAQLGITNAANTALQFVSTANGLPVPSTVLTGSTYSVTVTPEILKLETIGDILSSCVNGASANTSCSTIFGALSTGTAPKDTLQAAVLFGVNPTAGGATNMLALFNQVPSTAAPFPALSTEPADWTLGIQYTDTSSTCTTGDTGTCILNSPQEVLIDPSGNVWVMNHNTTTSASISELSPIGTPMLNVDKVGTTSFNAISPRNMALDTNGNVWFGTSTTSDIFEIVPGGTSLFLGPTSGPYAPVIDGNNNVFFGFDSTSAVAEVEEFLPTTAGGSASLTAAHQIEFPIDCSTTINAYTKCSGRSPAETNVFLPQYGAMDTNGVLWFSGGSLSPTGSVFTMSAFNGATVCTAFPCLNTTTGDTTLTQTYTVIAGGSAGLPTFSTPYGVAAGASGAVWFANSASNTLAEMTSTTAGANYGSATTLTKPTYPAVDGAGNVWVTNNGASSVSEIQGTGNNIGTALSPANSGTAPYTTVGFYHPGIGATTTAPNGVSIDMSGNVWIGSYVVSTGGIFEIVGAAAPTVAPIAQQLKSGKVGARP